MSRKANARGVVTIKVGERQVPLKLTLGVMADVEEEFQIESMDALPASGKAILFLLERMAKAAGAEVTQQELRDSDLDIATVMETVRALSGADASQGNAPAPSA